MQFQQLIEVPTRVNNISRSLIDHVYANFSSKCVHSGTIDTDISDHFPIYAIFEDELRSKVINRRYLKGIIDIIIRSAFVRSFLLKTGVILKMEPM